MENSRRDCRKIIQSLVPEAIWQENANFANELKQLALTHRISRHPVIGLLEGGEFGLEAMRKFHLEFRHAFAQNFTDALIHVMETASQLEPRQGALGKVAARFLVQLNVLDELGFEAGQVKGGEYAGDPRRAHYVEFDKVLSDLGVSEDEKKAYVPSVEAKNSRRTVEDVYGDHVLLATTLAMAETVFSKFAGPWASNMKKQTDVDTSEGYHAIHVEHEGNFIDDEHSEDMWFVLRQALEPARYDEARAKARETLDTWAAFCDRLLAFIK